MLEELLKLKDGANTVSEFTEAIRRGIPSAVFGVNEAFKAFLAANVDSPVLYVAKDMVTASAAAELIAEFSHIMILFDDERCEITEELYENRSKLKKLYDFELNMGGGSVEGYFVEDYKTVLEAFSKLSDKERLIKKYGKADEFIFAVGDGNHSLATAKAFWDEIKTGLTEEEKKTHPARFALAEFVNVYDEGIYFEPIYRFADGVNAKNFADGLKDVTDARFSVYRGGKESFYGSVNNVPEAIKAVDEYVKNYITAHGGKVDYIHGEEEVKKMADADENSVAILFSAINKSDLFRYVSENGAFPRKTFSMGEGEEKRYYLEGKRIK